MVRLARWHIWLGWLIGIPLLMWTISGLIMVARPIDEVRGEHLRKAQPPATLPADLGIEVRLPERLSDVEQITIRMERNQPVALATLHGGEVLRFSSAGQPLPPLDAQAAGRIVADGIKGGTAPMAIRPFSAGDAPIDFRRPIPVWQVTLPDGTHVYVGQQTGNIEAIRTPFWRIFDVAWGLHIMDLSQRENTHHPLLVLFAALAAIGTLLGIVLLFRRRSARRGNLQPYKARQ